MTDNTMPDTVCVDEEWIEKDGVVYRRIRWGNEDWSAWDKSPNQQFPWITKVHAEYV